MASDNQPENLTVDAIERRKRWREEKLAKGGIENVIQQEAERPWRVWFDQDGNIVCFGQHAPVNSPDTWSTYEFPQQEIEKLKEYGAHDLSKFRVRPDSNNADRMILDLKPLETVFLSKDRDFLSEIEYDGRPGMAQIVVKLTGDSLQVTLAQEVKTTLYKDIFPVSATINGHRLLKFYITAPNDPHVMYAYHTVALADLITQDTVTVKLDADLTGYSVYTQKQFDKYSRV